MTAPGAGKTGADAERPRPGTVIEVRLEAPAAGGEAVAHTAVGTVFATGGLPGERVMVRLADVRARFARGPVVKVLEPSPHRVPDRREALGAPGVGGMEYACADLAYSRELKGHAAADQLARIGGIAHTVTVAPAPSEAHAATVVEDDWRTGTRWRTRVQLAVDAAGRPGMLAPASHRVVPVEHVPLAVSAIDDAGVQDLVLPGATRIELAAGTASGAIVVSGPASPEALERLRAIAQSRGWSLVSRAGGARNRGGAGPSSGSKARRGRRGRRAPTAEPTLLAGPGYVTQHVAGMDYRVRAEGFWQVHTDAAEVLSGRVARLAAGARRVADLYCGAGLFALRLAAAGARVTGIEGSAQAVADAAGNAGRLLSEDAGEADFFAARIESLDTLPGADTIVVDPPRAGLGRSVTDLIAASGAERLVYVSCDGGTLARDASALLAHGFRLESLSAHDLFPLTGHVEFVSRFVR